LAEKNPATEGSASLDLSFRKGGIRDDKMTRIMHHTIKEVTEDLENFRYNTAIAHMMEYVNKMTENREQITEEQIRVLLLLLAPFAPYMTEELWSQLTTHSSIHLHPWPLYDPKYLVEEEVTVVIQVNGKMRETIRIQNSESEIQNKVEEKAKKLEKTKKYLEGKTIRKVIFVPDRLINFVVS